MKNLNTLILGQTGAGKTSLAKHLLAMAPRAFVFDPRDDYETAAPFYDFASAAAFYVENHARDFHLIYRGDERTYVAWLDILFRTQRQYNDPPLAVFLEESSLYSSSHKIDDYLERFYTQGRRQRINVVTVTQRDTQINPIIRANSHLWLSMRQRNPSSDVRALYSKADLERIERLETFTPISGPPIEGKHYIPDQAGFPVFDAWQEILSPDAANVAKNMQPEPPEPHS